MFMMHELYPLFACFAYQKAALFSNAFFSFLCVVARRQEVYSQDIMV